MKWPLIQPFWSIQGWFVYTKGLWEKNQISKFQVVTEAQETSLSLREKIPWGNGLSPTPPPFSKKQQAQGEGMFLIKHYKNQDQSGKNCRVALTLDLKFQVSLKLIQNILQVDTANDRSASPLLWHA